MTAVGAVAWRVLFALAIVIVLFPAPATRGKPDFIEAWVLNWGLEMSMLQQVQERLGPDYVCVRPDVLVDMRRHAAGAW